MVASLVVAHRTAWHDRLVGRDEELSVLLGAIAEARAGIPTLTIVEGPPGSGKSTLLQAATDLAGDVTTLWATGAEVERLLDLGVVDQLLADADAAGLGTTGAVPRGGSRPEPFELGWRLVELVSDAAERRPVVVALDDAQWADESSLQVLSFAVRRLRNAAVHVIVTRRPEVPHGDALRHLVCDRRARLLTLRELTPPQVRELVRRRTGVDVSEVSARRLHDHTGGNPLHCVTLTEELDPAVLASRFGPLPAPRDYRSFVLHRMASCPPPTELVVGAIVVLGRRATVADVARLVGIDDLAEAVSHAAATGLVRVEDVQGARTIDVAHPLVRAAVLADLTPGRRSWLEQRAAEVVTDPDRALLHRLRAVVGEDRELAEEAIARARALLALSWEGAAVDLLTAAASALPDGVERHRALLLAADRLVSAADVAGAAELLELVPAGAGGATGHLMRGRLAMLRGDAGAAEEAARAALGAGPDPEVSTAAAGLLATIAANRADAAATLRWARFALDRNDVDDSAHALTMLATAWTLADRIPSGRREVKRRLASRRSAPSRADGALALGVLALWSGRHAAADRSLRAVQELADRCPWLTSATATYSLADLAYRSGRWDEALRLAEGLSSTLDDRGRTLVGPMVHSVAGFVLAARGDTDRAADELQRAEDSLDRCGAPAGGLWLLVGRARLAAAGGDHEAVVDALAGLRELLREVALPEGVQPFRADLAEALLALGRVDEAAIVVDELVRRSARSGPHARVGARRATGLLAAARGDLSRADAEFRAGFAEGAGATGPFAMAQLELAAGTVLRRRGPRAEAAALLRCAEGRLAELGAEPARHRAERELAQCGQVRRGRLGDRTTLTAAEREVARLVCEGQTNREVAAELVVSVKTVESHLSRIFGKLGVRSRTELAHRWRAEQPA